MLQIDYYLSPLSPWVHLAGTRPAQIAAAQGATLVYKPVDPPALFARTGGKMLAERHESRQTYRLQELRRQAAKAGRKIHLKPQHWPTNPAPACYAIIAAQEAGGGDLAGLVHAITSACWEEQRNIADDAVIEDCLSAHGFSPNLTMTGLMTGADTYARNLDHAVLAGVFGMPFFVVGEERFWGQDRLDDLEAYLAAAT
ncbi:2-hydroxychromene-2-carboxylate isomerase [Roseicitreum antarcticum]|uniref:2-hydroxychromene-2-carboxylate isomerase n=1 Tax=Roseicitreum antarcticum TaxID=564137 RepID=A0A1H2UQ12_9RHOB|nr:2-hydroxychromene-2-carboxylate isomerase [Roseicitreum antarcticum]SDW57659.1 2-hydroxychromene-2-carboxylate isomerase [Roseicitreum antarcticum]